MKIVDIKTLVLAYKSKDISYRVAFGGISERNVVIVIVETDEGITGVGEANESTNALVIREIIEKGIKPLIIGEDPFRIEWIWNKVYRGSMYYGRKGALIVAFSGVEIALWDIIGKTLNVPIYEILGGLYRKRIRAYASALFPNKEPDELAKEAQKYVEQGFTAVKQRIGIDPKKDLERVKAVRKAIGDDILLMVDASWAWDELTAIKMGRKLEKYDIFWLEEPLKPDDIDGLSRVAAALDIPIAAGENEYTLYGFKELLMRRAVDICQPDVTRAGGILECKKICAMASAWNIQCAPHIWGSGIGLLANLHLIASTPNCIIAEVDCTGHPFRDDILAEPVKIKDGYIEVPNKPGLGAILNEDQIRRYSTERIELLRIKEE